MKNIKYNKLILPIVFIITGILFMIFKGEVVKWIAMAIGVFFAIDGVITLTKTKHNEIRSVAIIEIVLGIVLFIFAWVFVKFIEIILGLVIILYGTFRIIQAVCSNHSKNVIVDVAIGIIQILAGIFIIFDASILYIILGALLLVDGIIELVSIYNKNDKNKKNKVIEAEIKEL